MAAGRSEHLWQTKYAKNIKIAYGLAVSEDNLRILSYVQRNQSSDHNRFVFYKSGEIDAKDAPDNYNSSNNNYDVLAGIDITDFGQAVSVVPTKTHCPFYRDKYADIMSQVSLEGNLIMASASGMYKSTLKKLLTPIKMYTVDGSFPQQDEKGNITNIAIPAGQIYGDKTKTFFENEEEFMRMLAELEVKSSGEGMVVNVGALFGTKGMTALKKYDRASDNDFITTTDFVTKLGKKLSIKKFDIMEMIPLAGFDIVFPVTEGYMAVIFDQAVGYDSNQNLDSVAKLLDERDAKFFNTTTFDQATIVDEKGIFLFQWNGIVGDRVVKTEDITATP